jgi:hypothetical protein
MIAEAEGRRRHLEEHLTDLDAGREPRHPPGRSAPRAAAPGRAPA